MVLLAANLAKIHELRINSSEKVMKKWPRRQVTVIGGPRRQPCHHCEYVSHVFHESLICHPRGNVKYYCQNLTLDNQYFQNGKLALGYLLARPKAGFRPCFFAILGKCRRLYGVKPTRSRREAIAITAQSRCDYAVKPTLFQSIGNA